MFSSSIWTGRLPLKGTHMGGRMIHMVNTMTMVNLRMTTAITTNMIQSMKRTSISTCQYGSIPLCSVH